MSMYRSLQFLSTATARRSSIFLRNSNNNHTASLRSFSQWRSCLLQSSNDNNKCSPTCTHHAHNHNEKENGTESAQKKYGETYQRLFDGNREFVRRKLNVDPDFFKNLASKSQTPQIMLIGCSDSRVPPDQLTMTQPGDIFIHRNVANLVVNTDLNVNTVLQYAVEVLKVKHVIVMGHYKCGGVLASMENTDHGLIDKWLRNIKDVQRLHKDKLDACATFEERFNLLVELNVIEQTLNLCKTRTVQRAWKTGQELHVHGWVYDLATGIIKDLEIEEKVWKDIAPIYKIRFPDLPYKGAPKKPQDMVEEDDDVGVPTYDPKK